MNIFTYGSLMYIRVWEKVVRGRYDSAEATVCGFARKKVIGESYPGLIRASEDSTVTGLLYYDVSDPDLGLLDNFEGEYYERIEIPCILPGGSVRPANTFLFKRAYSHLLDNDDWNPLEFNEDCIDRFIRDYRGF
jgi:gamma-glutamylcyclotransferase (GGCT)/AIG2-like uncharacterized protein YtfP